MEIEKEKESLSCMVLTPMFSAGMNKDEPEFRPSELKGLMRYVFRITQQTMETSEMLKAEGVIFGNAEKYASPICLQIRGESEQKKDILCSKTEKERTVYEKAIQMNNTFDIILRRRRIHFDHEDIKYQKDMDWYIKLIRLSLLLGGMGRRSRRARGCVSVAPEFHTIEEVKQFLCDTLNEIMIGSDISSDSYQVQDGSIIYSGGNHPERNCLKDEKIKRPVIEKIIIGKKIDVGNQEENAQGMIKNVEKILIHMDEVSHETKKKLRKIQTDFRNMDKRYATGNCHGGKRFASPIIVSLIKVKEGYFPVYTYVKAIFSGKLIDGNQNERNTFVEKMEEGVRK